MNLTEPEKLTLLMLSEIYEKLEINGEIDPVFVKAAILGNHTWAFSWKYQGLYEEEITPDEASEVNCILLMWRTIEESFANLTPSDQETVNASPGIGSKDHFNGFDGNHESKQLSIAKFLIDHLDRFKSTFSNRDLGNGVHTLERHRQLLRKYQEMDKLSLDKDELIELFQ